MRAYKSVGGLFTCTVCAKCQLGNSNNAIYCQHCSTKLDSIICPKRKCGKVNLSDATKCKKCNTIFNDENK